MKRREKSAKSSSGKFSPRAKIDSEFRQRLLWLSHDSVRDVHRLCARGRAQVDDFKLDELAQMDVSSSDRGFTGNFYYVCAERIPLGEGFVGECDAAPREHPGVKIEIVIRGVPSSPTNDVIVHERFGKETRKNSRRCRRTKSMRPEQVDARKVQLVGRGARAPSSACTAHVHVVG